MQQNREQFEFHGKTGEFFKVWIVNILLSVVTLGIYSAWAKVRNRQYFYSNTLLMNTPFNYLADPVKILKGRILVLVVFLGYTFSALVSPILQGVLLIIFIPLLPWVIIKSLKFNMYNLAYRNIRFHFKAEYLKALWVFLGLPILVAFSLGLAYPYFIRAQKKFVIDHTLYGRSQFDMEASIGKFYSIFLKTVGLLLLVGILFAALIGGLNFMKEIANVSAEANFFVMGLSLMFFPFYMMLFGYWYANITNLVISNTTLYKCQFISDLKTSKICWIFFSNTLAIILSLGLLIPWAMIRTANYRISCMSLNTTDDLEEFIADEAENADAIGEEIGGFLDIDLGL